METRRKATKATAAKSARKARRRAHSIVAPNRQQRHLLEEGGIVIHQLLENVGLNRRDALQRRGHRRSLELKGRRERHRERPKSAGTARRSDARGQRRNTDGALKRDFACGVHGETVNGITAAGSTTERSISGIAVLAPFHDTAQRAAAVLVLFHDTAQRAAAKTRRGGAPAGAVGP